jgi:hypothetical protein
MIRPHAEQTPTGINPENQPNPSKLQPASLQQQPPKLCI